MNIKRYLLYILTIITFTTGGLSCKKLIRVAPPKSQLTADKAYTNDNSADAVLSNVYTQFENSYLEANLIPYISLYGDEVYPTTADEESWMYYNNAIVVNDYSNANVWESAFFIIYECNSVLENLPGSSGITRVTKKRLTGEAGFLRAFAYYFLVNLYGDVPLVLSTNVRKTSHLPRDPAADIYKHIIRDLSAAEINLPETYPGGEKTRANKWCAASLLARIYLYTEDWKGAEVKSSEVINSGQYNLDVLNKAFLNNSTEAILQCWQQTGYTRTGSNFIPGSFDETPLYALDSTLLKSFEPGDLRKKDWLDSVMISGQLYYYPFKYKLRSPAIGNETEYTMLLRLGEQYLIRAEARAHQNDLTGAVSDLNVIRTRAGLPKLPVGLSQSEVLSAVAHERRTELFTEWGHRFFDLKRTGRMDAVLSAVKPSWHPTAQLYPIPQNELDNNPHLTQNTGY